MSKKRYIRIFIFGLFCYFQSIQCVTFGSDTVAALVTGATAPPTGAASGNVLLGFSVFAGPITFADSATVCRYNNYFPLYGALSLNGGLLNLNRNLTLASSATLTNGGQINGNSFSLTLPTSPTPFVINGGTMGNITLVVNSPVQLTSLLTFTNTCVIEGNNNIIDCTAGALAIGTGGKLLIQNATLKGLSDPQFYCYDNTGTVTLENVTFALNNTLTFSLGRLELLGNNLFTGAQTFVFQSTIPLKINSNTTWMFDSAMIFSCPILANNLLVFSDITSVLRLYESTFAVSSATGIVFTKGTIMIEGLCTFLDFALNPAQAIFIGDGISAANNFKLNILPESGINIVNGYLVNNNI